MMNPKRIRFFIFSLLLVLLTLLSLSAIVSIGQTSTAAAQAAALLWLDPAEAVAVTGASKSVDLTLSNVSNVYGIEVNLAFDPDILSIVGEQLTPGSCPAPDFVLANSADNLAGTIEYAATHLNPTPPCDGGDVATIEVACADGLLEEVTTPITITSSLVSDPDGSPIIHSTQNGAVRCEVNIFFIQGAVALQAWPNPEGVQVELKDNIGTIVDTLVVGSDGLFQFTGYTGETYSVEASYDRYLTSLATGITSNITGETIDLGTTILRAGDLNGDGVINILDISGAAGNFNKTSPQPWVP